MTALFRTQPCESEQHNDCNKPGTCTCPCHTYDAIRAAVAAGVKFTDDNMTPALQMSANNWVAAYTGDFDYVLDLQRKLRTNHKLSIGQLRGAANCMLAEERRKVAAANIPTLMLDGNYKAVVEFMANVPLQYPKLRMAFEGAAIRLNRAGPASKYAGAVNITAEELTWNARDMREERRWLGRIELDGKLTAGKGMTNVIIGMLDALALNPAEVAAAYGKLTSRCCFCGKELTTDESLAVGYGPECADNYGLPWGKVA